MFYRRAFFTTQKLLCQCRNYNDNCKELRTVLINTFLTLFILLIVFPVRGEVPSYCQNFSENAEEFIGTACQEYLLYRHGSEQVDKLSEFSHQLTAQVEGVAPKQIKQNLYQMTLSRMLSKKLNFLSLYPDLGVGASRPFYTVKKERGVFSTSTIDRDKTQSLKQCLHQEPDLVTSIKKAQRQYKQTLNNTTSNQYKAMQQNYVSQLVVSAIKAKKDWDRVPGIRNKKDKIEQRFKNARIQTAGFRRQLRRSHGERRKKLHKMLNQSEKNLEALSSELDSVNKKLKGIQSSVLSDPLWSEATGILDFDSNDKLEDFKPSPFFKEVMSSLNLVHGKKNSGKEFVSFLSSLIEKGDSQQAMLRINHLLQVNPQLFNKLNGAVKENLKGQLNDVDSSMQQLCETKGEGLSQYQLLVDELAGAHVKKSFDDKSDAKQKLEMFRESHCSLIKQEESSGHGLAGTLVFGGILLAGAALAPFTGGGSLAVGLMFAGGLGLTTMGGLETYQSYKKLDIEKGMLTANLVTAQQVRSTLSDVRVNTGMSILDVALMPLDVIQLAKVASKARSLEHAVQEGSHVNQVNNEQQALLSVTESESDLVSTSYRSSYKGASHDTAVEQAQKGRDKYLKERVPEAESVVNKSRSEVRSSAEALTFKKKYQDLHLELRNDRFIDTLDTPAVAGKKHLFFDVENSVLKKLNDVVFEDKALGDAAGNLFSSRIYELIKKDPVLSKKLVADYKDYKSIRFKFLLDESEDAAKYEKRLAEIYKQANKEFVQEIDQAKLSPLWDGMYGQIAHPSQWFLAGTGPDAIKANMATRGGREILPKSGEGVISSFENHRHNLQRHLDSILEIRDSMSANRKMVGSGLVVKGKNGNFIMDDTAIEIVRKAESGKGDAFRRKDIRAKVKKLYGVELNDTEINHMVNYFDEVDSMSPPLFLRKREIIPYENADHGIVSVDFAGIGVNNTRQAMEGVNLAAVGAKTEDWVDSGLKQINTHVDEVTRQMGGSKEYYRDVIKRAYSDKKDIYFSGDDGIYLPKRDLTKKEKERVVRMISSNDPKQFRMTFVKTRFSNGRSVPSNLRSEYVVKAEKLEKAIRKEVTGVGADLIDRKSAEKMMIAVDYVPHDEASGAFNIFVSGEVSSSQLKKIKQVFAKQANEGGRVGKVYYLPK